MRRTRDLLVQLALEHRDLTALSRATSERRADDVARTLREVATRIVEHELAHRLLVHPLLRRDSRGMLLFRERREEQLLLADRLRHALTAAGDVPPHDAPPARGASGLAPGADPVRGLDDEFAAHTDREEILAFPHLRRLVPARELLTLGVVRDRLRGVIGTSLRARDTPVTDGGWATAARADLPALLDLPAELVAQLPEANGERTIEVPDLEHS